MKRKNLIVRVFFLLLASAISFLLIDCGGKSGGSSISQAIAALVGGGSSSNSSSDSQSSTSNQTSSTNTGGGPAYTSNPPDHSGPTSSSGPPPRPTGGTSGSGSGSGGSSTPKPAPKIEVMVDSTSFSSGTFLDFCPTWGNCMSGMSAITKQITVKNVAASGAKDLIVNVASIVTVVQPNPFHDTATSSYTIPAGSQATFQVTFNPAGNSGYMVGTLEMTSNSIVDPDYKVYVKGFVADIPSAVVLKPATGADLYQNIVIDFSYSMDKSAICAEGQENSQPNNFVMYETNNPANKVYGHCHWSTYRQLIFDPYKPLKQLTNYTISFPTNTGNLSAPGAQTIASEGSFPLRKACLVSDPGCNSLSLSFQTEPKFDMTFSLNGFSLGSKGLILDRSAAANLNLSSTLTNSSFTKSIVVKKLGVSGISVPWNSSLTLNNFPSAMQPENGSNVYFVEITSNSGKKYYESFSFQWGTTGNPLSPVPSTVQATLGPGYPGMEQLPILFQKFSQSNGNHQAASGNFTINNKTLTGFLTDNQSNQWPVTRYGETCPAPPNNFYYFVDLGPFCHITDCVVNTLFGCLISADVDVYVVGADFQNYINGQPNAQVSMVPIGDKMKLTLNARSITGKLGMIVHQLGDHQYTTNYAMNKGGPYDLRHSEALTTWTIPNSDGRINVGIVGSDGVVGDYKKTIADGICGSNYNSDANSTFLICDWSSHIKTDSVSGASGVIGTIVGWVVDTQIPKTQPVIVQGMLRDFYQNIAANILNAVLAQMRMDNHYNGIDVNLPSYLPEPFNHMRLNIGANARQTNNSIIKNSTLEWGFDSVAFACDTRNSTCPGDAGYTPPSNGPTPPYTSGAAKDEYIRLHPNSAVPDSQISRIQSDGGVLISLRSDPVNQAMYHMWKQGALNLNLNQAFADSVKAYRGDSDRLFQIFQILLQANNMMKVLAPGMQAVYYDNTHAILPSDQIEFHLRPLLPPVIDIAPLSLSKTQGNNRKLPLTDIALSGLLVDVVGIQNGNSYTIATLKINLRSRAALNAHMFSSPINGGNNNWQDVTAVQLNVCDDNLSDPAAFDCDLLRSTNTSSDDLSYTLEVVENPLGLDPNGIYQVLNPSVQKLIVPTLNYVLEELPLETKYAGYTAAEKEDPNMPKNKIMAACGMRINDLSFLPIDASTADPYFLINAHLSDYTFSDDCSI